MADLRRQYGDQNQMRRTDEHGNPIQYDEFGNRINENQVRYDEFGKPLPVHQTVTTDEVVPKRTTESFDTGVNPKLHSEEFRERNEFRDSNRRREEFGENRDRHVGQNLRNEEFGVNRDRHVDQNIRNEEFGVNRDRRVNEFENREVRTDAHPTRYDEFGKTKPIQQTVTTDEVVPKRTTESYRTGVDAGIHADDFKDSHRHTGEFGERNRHIEGLEDRNLRTNETNPNRHDEFGKPIHQNQTVTTESLVPKKTVESYDTVGERGFHGSGHGLTTTTVGAEGKLHRSGSSSSEDDGMGGRRKKKGFMDKMREKMPGQRKDETAPPPPPPEEHPQEKRSLMDKIRGGRENTEADRHETTNQTDYGRAPTYATTNAQPEYGTAAPVVTTVPFPYPAEVPAANYVNNPPGAQTGAHSRYDTTPQATGAQTGAHARYDTTHQAEHPVDYKATHPATTTPPEYREEHPPEKKSMMEKIKEKVSGNSGY